MIKLHFIKKLLAGLALIYTNTPLQIDNSNYSCLIFLIHKKFTNFLNFLKFMLKYKNKLFFKLGFF